MNSKNFLKPKNFKIKAKSLSFESVKFMTDLEKKKIYINFVKFLNNHFKRTLFKKNLYEHFHCNCGFIAHYNINGFYGEYFETAASYHYNVNNYENPMNEYSGNLNRESTLSHGEQFYAIYEELNSSRDGLGEFYDTIMSNENYGGYADYADLDGALIEAFNEYMEIWREEIRKAVKAYDKFSKDEKIQKLNEKKEELRNEQKRLDETTRAIEETLIEEASKVKIIEEESNSKVAKKQQQNLFDFAA